MNVLEKYPIERIGLLHLHIKYIIVINGLNFLKFLIQFLFLKKKVKL